MSEERLDQNTPVTPEAKGPESKGTEKKKKVRRRNRIARYFREMRSELKKVVWMTRKQVVNNTGIALIIMLASAVAVWGIDKIAEVIISAILTLGG